MLHQLYLLHRNRYSPALSVCAQAVNDGKPISVRVGSGGVTITRPVCVTASGGAWSMLLPDVSQTSPQNATFALTAIDNITGDNLLSGYSHIQPSSVAPSGTSGWWCTPSGCSLDNLAPDAPAQALKVSGPGGPQGPAATINSNSASSTWGIGETCPSGATTGTLCGANVPVSASQYGSVGDNNTDDTAAFAAMEASTTEEFSLPPGRHKTTLSTLSKSYKGEGSVSLAGGGFSVAGRHAPELIGYDHGISDIGALVNGTSPVTMVSITDSIGVGYGISGLDYHQAYLYKAQMALNGHEGGNGQGGMLSGGNFDPSRITTTGTWSYGTAGPLHSSLILQSGASATFQADDVGIFWFYFQRQPGGGTITVSNTVGTYGTQSTAGATADDVISAVMSAPNGSPDAQSITLSCSGGPCEITGKYGYHAAPTAFSAPLLMTLQGYGGYNTSDFTSSAVLSSIAAQVAYKDPAGFWLAYIALGTNNIFNAGKATTSAQYKADIITIVTTLKTLGAFPILTVPLRAHVGAGYPSTEVLEPFDNYRRVTYEVARQYDLPVIDWSEINLTHAGDWASGGAYSPDGLHPGFYGHSIMAAYFAKKLGLTSFALPKGSLPLESSINIPFSATLTLSNMRMWNKVFLTGDVTASTWPVVTDGQRGCLRIQQDGVGGRGFVFPANVLNPGTLPTTPFAIYAKCFTSFADGGLWIGQ